MGKFLILLVITITMLSSSSAASSGNPHLPELSISDRLHQPMYGHINSYNSGKSGNWPPFESAILNQQPLYRTAKSYNPGKIGNWPPFESVTHDRLYQPMYRDAQSHNPGQKGNWPPVESTMYRRMDRLYQPIRTAKSYNPGKKGNWPPFKSVTHEKLYQPIYRTDKSYNGKSGNWPPSQAVFYKQSTYRNAKSHSPVKSDTPVKHPFELAMLDKLHQPMYRPVKSDRPQFPRKGETVCKGKVCKVKVEACVDCQYEMPLEFSRSSGMGFRSV